MNTVHWTAKIATVCEKIGCRLEENDRLFREENLLWWSDPWQRSVVRAPEPWQLGPQCTAVEPWRESSWSLATGVSPSWGLLHGGATCIRSVWCDSRYVIVHAVLIVKSFYLKTEILIYVLLTIFTYSMIWFTINLWISSQSCAKNASDFEYKHVSCIWFIIYVDMQALIKSKPF